MELMNKCRLTKVIYIANVKGVIGRKRLQITFSYQNVSVLKKGKVRNRKNKRVCMKRFMNVIEARKVSQEVDSIFTLMGI